MSSQVIDEIAFVQAVDTNARHKSNTTKGVIGTPNPAKEVGFVVDSPSQLAVLAQHNVRTAAYDAWRVRDNELVPLGVRMMFDRWYDILHKDLLDDHKPGRSAIHRQNPRFRTWDVHYLVTSPAYQFLGEWLMDFSEELVARRNRARASPYSPKKHAGLIAWADYEMDQIGHPWRDGCGRMSTVLVYWLSASIRAPKLPVLGTREEHYASCSSIKDHAAYFLRSLE